MAARDFADSSCRAFVEMLASDAPVPGGGGAAALVGAVGTALGNMVASLTVGKKKYAAVEDEIRALAAKCTKLQAELLDAVRADAENFEPLAAAYAIPKDDPCRAEVLEAASVQACATPMRILELCAAAVSAVAALAEKGSRLAVSDAGCAAACIGASARSAALNLYINTKTMRDRAVADDLNRRADALLRDTEEKTNAVYEQVLRGLR